MECPSCVSELDHCHGTLVRHEDDVVECTDDGCRDLDPARHALTIGCDEVHGGCPCTAVYVEEFLQAS